MLCWQCSWLGDYFGIVMFIRDKFHPKVIVSDEFGRFIVVEICYEGQVLWLVGVYASNVSQERKLLWRSLNSVLDNGRPSLLMGDFNVRFIVRKILLLLE